MINSKIFLPFEKVLDEVKIKSQHSLKFNFFVQNCYQRIIKNFVN